MNFLLVSSVENVLLRDAWPIPLAPFKVRLGLVRPFHSGLIFISKTNVVLK